MEPKFSQDPINEKNYYSNTDIEFQEEEFVIDCFLESLENVEEKMKIPQIITIIAFASYLIFLTICLSIQGPINPINFVYTLIPGIISLISLTVLMNLYVKWIDIYSQARVYMESKKQTGVTIGSLVSYFTINVTALGMFIYFITITLKVQGIIDTQMNILNIPMYTIFGVIVFYFLFFLPAFIKEKAWWTIVFFSICLTSGLAFLLLISMIIDKTIELEFTKAFTLIWTPLTCLFIWSIIRFFTTGSRENKNPTKELFLKISNLFSSFLFLGFAVILPLKLDNILEIYNWALMMFLILSYTLLFSSYFHNTVFSRTESESVENTSFSDKQNSI